MASGTGSVNAGPATSLRKGRTHARTHALTRQLVPKYDCIYLNRAPRCRLVPHALIWRYYVNVEASARRTVYEDFDEGS